MESIEQRRPSRGGKTYGSGGYSGERSSSRSGYGSGGAGMSSNRDRIVERALRPAGPAKHGAESLGLKVGDDVGHATFGDGVILMIEGTGDKAEAVIRFPGVGEKRPVAVVGPAQEAVTEAGS